jgi:hypothetical protein
MNLPQLTATAGRWFWCFGWVLITWTTQFSQGYESAVILMQFVKAPEHAAGSEVHKPYQQHRQLTQAIEIIMSFVV